MASLTIESIYTDGACTGNPGPGGWGVVVYFDDGSVHEMGDGCRQTTNNRMEMQAAIAALQYLEASGQSYPVTLYTDSEYLINCVTKWVKSWKNKGWKKADGKPVQNQDLLEILDELNSRKVRWEHVRGHAGNIGNERCDTIARAFAAGKTPVLKHSQDTIITPFMVKNQLSVANVSEIEANSTIINEKANVIEIVPNNTPENFMVEASIAANNHSNEDIPREMRVTQLRNLVDTLRIADEIAEKGYLITSSELADLMDVHASAVTSRGDQWRWRNWIVSRVRREGNQILWELERGDKVEEESVDS
ncbi:MAG: ribonuclease HI [Calothrix sp. C42_A2020_038]|nr:ribonuclease HI [Calothrix sp. C42_A2020_038]